MSKPKRKTLNYILMLIAIIVGPVLIVIALGDLLQTSEKIAFLAVAMVVVIGIVYSIRGGNRTSREDELVKLLTNSTTSIYSLVDNAPDVKSLPEGISNNLQSEQIRKELHRVKILLSQVRNSDRFKRLDSAEEIAKRIASLVERIESVQRIEETEKFYNEFQGSGNIILDIYRIIKDLESQGNWLRAR